MAKSTIKTHSTESFRDSYIQHADETDKLLKPDFGKFFIVPVEHMLRLIRLLVPPSRATTHTLIYLTEGEANMTIGSDAYTIYKSECLIVPAGQFYSFAHADVNSGYLCNFHNDFFIGGGWTVNVQKEFAFLNLWGEPRIPLDGNTSAFVQRLFERMLTGYTAYGLARPDLIRAPLIALLYELAYAGKSTVAPAQSAAVSISGRFRELLYVHFKTRQFVTDYAALLRVSPNHLNKAVKSVTGKSPARWIEEAIVLEAKVLLYQSRLSVGEVADDVGVGDASYFSRLFKKHTGMAPLAYRRRIEKS